MGGCSDARSRQGATRTAALERTAGNDDGGNGGLTIMRGKARTARTARKEKGKERTKIRALLVRDLARLRPRPRQSLRELSNRNYGLIARGILCAL
jgi:hypothetical protein